MRSFVGQHAQAGWQVDIVVVDNNPDPACMATVTEVGAELPFEARCVNESHPGIPAARNRALEEALAGGADWIAFIDDDEALEPGWLETMTGAPGRYDADAFAGPVRPVVEGGDPSTPVTPKTVRRDEGAALRTAATGNVMMHRRLIAEDGMGLRFDDAMQFTGGEDNDFFYRATDRGARIRWIQDASVIEAVSAHRFTFRYQLRRAYRNASNSTFGQLRRNGRLHTIGHSGIRALGRMAVGILFAVATPFGLFQGRERVRSLALKAGREFATVAGFVAGSTPWRPQPYKRRTHD